MARRPSPARRLAAATLGGLLGLAGWAGSTAAAPAESTPASAAAAQLLVAWHPGTDRATMVADLARVGAVEVDAVEQLGVAVVEVDPARVAAALAGLRADPDVAYAEADQEVASADTVPTDPRWAEEWGPARTRAPLAWDTTTGDPSVVIAILDSGVDATIADLAGAVVAGRDLINNDDDPSDDYGHGTSVAGVAAARANDGVGIAGYCWRCSVMPVKVLDADGFGSLSTVAAGITYAADRGARVLNLSLSAPSPSRTMEAAVTYARGKGAVVVAAAGNDGDAIPQYPAASPGVIGVAATDETDGRYGFSSFGAWSELAAPGCATAPRRGGTWGTFCGTSSATPAVAGIAGLLFSARPTA
ncbi:MAG: S8 family serine peptidase, partial [Acidimicrobiales bacterium]